MRKIVTFVMFVSLGVWCAVGLSRADDKKASPPDEKALMEAMTKAGTPGEHHKKLDVFIGSWDVNVMFWMDPSKEPMEAKGSAEMKWIFGDRFVEQKFTGDFGGMKFHGFGLTGYDNLQKKYTTMWVDNMSTSIATASGTYNPDKKTFSYVGEEIDPLSGQKVKTKSVIHLLDQDKHQEEFFKEMDGKDVKVMEITYTRTKK